MANCIKGTIYFFNSETQLFLRASLFQRLISTPAFSLRYLTSIHRFLSHISCLLVLDIEFFWISETKLFPALDFPCSHISIFLKTIFLQSPPIAIHHNVPPPTIRYGYWVLSPSPTPSTIPNDPQWSSMIVDDRHWSSMIIILMIVNDRLDGSEPSHCIHDEQATSKLQSQETE